MRIFLEDFFEEVALDEVVFEDVEVEEVEVEDVEGVVFEEAVLEEVVFEDVVPAACAGRHRKRASTKTMRAVMAGIHLGAWRRAGAAWEERAIRVHLAWAAVRLFLQVRPLQTRNEL